MHAYVLAALILSGSILQKAKGSQPQELKAQVTQLEEEKKQLINKISSTKYVQISPLVTYMRLLSQYVSNAH